MRYRHVEALQAGSGNNDCEHCNDGNPHAVFVHCREVAREGEDLSDGRKAETKKAAWRIAHQGEGNIRSRRTPAS